MTPVWKMSSTITVDVCLLNFVLGSCSCLNVRIHSDHYLPNTKTFECEDTLKPLLAKHQDLWMWGYTQTTTCQTPRPLNVRIHSNHYLPNTKTFECEDTLKPLLAKHQDLWMWGYTQTTTCQTPRPIQFLNLCSGYIPIIFYLLMRCRHNTESCSCLEAWTSLDSSVLNTQILPDCVPSSTCSAVTCNTHRMRPSRNMVPMPWTHTSTHDWASSERMREAAWLSRGRGPGLSLIAHSLSIPLLCISHFHRMTTYF